MSLRHGRRYGVMTAAPSMGAVDDINTVLI